MLTIKEIKPVAIVSQLASQQSQPVSESAHLYAHPSVSRKILPKKKYWKSQITPKEGFMVDLNTFLSLVLPNQYCLDFTM